MIEWTRRRFYYSWITFSCALCAVMFFPWYLPRESISGLLGRWLTQETGIKHRFAVKVAPVIDMLFHSPWGLESCEETYALEQASREALYIRGEC